MIMKQYAPWDKNYMTAEASLFWSVTDGDHVLTHQEKAFLSSRYDCEISYLDHCLGHLFDRLRDLGLYDDTLIIVTADHGEAFGEHNHTGHILTLYEELLRVPLIIKYPATYPYRGAVEKRVSLVDLMPTVLSFLNYSMPSKTDGEPLEDSDHVIIAESDVGWWMAQGTITKYLRYLKAVYQGNYKYIWSSNGLNELYDLEKDPGEKENLIKKSPHQAQEMQKTLNQWLASYKSPSTKGEEIKIDQSTEEKLRALGYVK
jgi:arylsulfatase A-like enzyme